MYNNIKLKKSVLGLNKCYFISFFIFYLLSIEHFEHFNYIFCTNKASLAAPSVPVN